MTNSKPKRSSKTKGKSSAIKEVSQAHIGELGTAKVPISPETIKSSSAWQHASMVLKQQQMSSTLKSSEERDQDISTSERSQNENNNHHSAYGYDAARIGSGSCWSSFQSIFMIPQGLADIKASHAVTLNPDASNNNLSSRLDSGGRSDVPRSRFSNSSIVQTSISRSQGGSPNYNTKLSGDL